jgi:murein L,D-transpeptidase YcbB/YkuD
LFESIEGAGMFFRLLVIFFAVLGFAGCAATSKKQDLQIQQIESHLNYLESAVNKHEDEIVKLKNDQADSGLKPVYSFNEDLKEFNDEIADTDFDPPSVSEIQKALKNAGFYKGGVDGKIGPRTSEAIRSFQKDEKLKADGVVGKMTWTALKKYLK